MFKIGDFSKLSNLTIRALHHYEELGILIPDKIDTMSNYRYYSSSQLATANQIKMLQRIGLSLKSIKEIIDGDNPEILESGLLAREMEIQNEIAELKIKQNLIDMYKKTIHEGRSIASYHVEIKTVPKRNVMSIRKCIPSYQDEAVLWNALYEKSIQQNVKMATPYQGMSIYHDKEYKEENVDIEVQSNVVGIYENIDDVTFYETKPFVMASIIFHGSFQQMEEVTQALASWIEANHYVIDGPMIQIPHVSPAQDDNPENWITEAGYAVRLLNIE
ncbi:MerR family transcriptional regulator [Breznakia blatticola]|uniref:MerR family transcriptional regulator n=1 Tax=Breznakia blatticola TaxID=1754012 RepID=A0A4R7ZGX3_9FIRM|nr:MerR family transcriptional regulator [Breznakia blatticola]TDW16306.1 MerR family transcriptional regulator [Breznakia blatticola]